MTERADVVVIGAGLIGLATAYRLLEAEPGLSVTVVDKERAVARHQSGRNSGVLHSGLYYRPGSRRALLCRRGKAELERYAAERGIPVLPLGKVVVAVEEDEEPRLRALLDRGRANGIVGLELLDGRELRDREPNVSGRRALLVPGTAVVDYRMVAAALAEDVRALGGTLALGRRVHAVVRRDGHRVVRTDREEVAARVVVACAGLQSDRLAAAMGLRTTYRIVPFRGTYRELRAGGERLVHGLVYPVPDPSLPFLGVHFTPQADGSVLIGPNAVISLSREAEARGVVSPRDVAGWVTYPGFWRLAGRHLGAGAEEVWRELVRPAFLRECRRYVPALQPHHLGAVSSGVRAQLMTSRGDLVDDFVIMEARGRVVVLNAPSPAATASLAIGEQIAARCREQLAA